MRLRKSVTVSDRVVTATQTSLITNGKTLLSILNGNLVVYVMGVQHESL